MRSKFFSVFGAVQFGDQEILIELRELYHRLAFSNKNFRHLHIFLEWLKSNIIFGIDKKYKTIF
jgi:hypothetical protein